MIGHYIVTDLYSFGVPGVDVEGAEFYLKDLNEMIGRERNMTSFMFRSNSSAKARYGEMVTGVLFNNVETGTSVDPPQHYSDPNILRIESYDSALTIEQRKSLKYKGVPIAELLKISYATFSREFERHPSGKKVVPNIVLVELEMPKVDVEKFQLSYFTMKHNDGVELIQFEKELFIGTMLGMRNYVIDRRILKAFGFGQGSILKNTNVCLAALNAKASRTPLSKDELETKANCEVIKLTQAVGHVLAEFEKAKIAEKTFGLDSDVAKRIYANAIKFKPAILLHGKKQVYWDLPSYLHIVMRHVETYQVGTFMEKSVLPYELEDLKDLIKKVLGRVQEEIELHYASSSKPFIRSGAMAILFNGDYFIVRIDPDGRLNQFYIPD